MSSELDLFWAVVSEGGLLAALVLSILASALSHELRRRKLTALPGVRARLAQALVEGDELGPDLRALPPDLQIELLEDLSRFLTGQPLQRLRDMARHRGLEARAQSWCRSRSWLARLRGVRLLSSLGADSPLIDSLLRDPSDPVRAEAAQWAAVFPTPERVRRLLELLADRTVARFSVQDALLKLGDGVAETLSPMLKETHDTEWLISALEVASILADARYLSAGLRFCGHPDPALRARAADLLGALGGQEGTDALLGLVQDPESDVRARSAAALGRLEFWPAAPALGEALRDPAWEVRRHAALALCKLGAPGRLALKRATEGADRFACDMARYVLELS
ncbi:MAG: hypothetical protein AMXMBFR33_12040 [Candidatus Xenobia bacterium]